MKLRGYGAILPTGSSGTEMSTLVRFPSSGCCTAQPLRWEPGSAVTYALPKCSLSTGMCRFFYQYFYVLESAGLCANVAKCTQAHISPVMLSALHSSTLTIGHYGIVFATATATPQLKTDAVSHIAHVRLIRCESVNAALYSDMGFMARWHL